MDLCQEFSFTAPEVASQGYPRIFSPLIQTLTDPTFGDVCFTFDKYDPKETRKIYASHQLLINFSEYFQPGAFSIPIGNANQ